MIGQNFVLIFSTFPYDKNEIDIDQHFPSFWLNFVTPAEIVLSRRVVRVIKVPFSGIYVWNAYSQC